MPIELKQSLRLSQQLVITPQLQQAIKLLQLSRLELTELIQSELLENPMLEEGPQVEEEEVSPEVEKELESEAMPDKSHEAEAEVGNKDGQLSEPKEFDWENYIGTYNAPGDEIRSFRDRDELPNYENMVTKAATLSDHLEWQLRMNPMSKRDEEIGAVIISFIDDQGYLSVPLEEIAEKEGYPLEELKKVLKIVQDFDPTGVGARDLKECLLLQARQFGSLSPLLEAIISDYLPLLEKKDYLTLARKLNLSIPKVLEAVRIISEMEPKPGRPFGRNETQYITPDVFVYKLGDDYTIVLNEEGLPRLRISALYRNLIAKNGDKTNSGVLAKDYVQDKLKGALWLIKSIHQRQRTLYRVSKCIVRFQRDFFDKGVEHLRPMVLKDVAEEIGVHESTVSRATTNKYMHTPQGIFELKFFFNSGISQVTGNDIASEAVKEKIRNIVAGENNRKPLSDKEIVKILKATNIDIARRTVAKYRETLAILPSSKRKQLYPR